MKFILIFVFIIFSTIANAYNLSNFGKENIKKNESCQLTAYWDSNGWSIGYGHHSKEVKKGQKISQSKANYYFNKDIEWVNISINRLINELPVKHNFSQSFIDGLGDLIYNCGEYGVKSSEFYKRLQKCRKNNRKDLEFSIVAVKNCRISSKGHIERRYNTYKMMLK